MFSLWMLRPWCSGNYFNISVAVLLYRGTKLDEQYCDKVFVRRYELGIEIFTVIADLHVRITALELLSSGDETVE